VCLHYLLNRLQPLPVPSRWWCRSTRRREIDPRHTVLGEYDYAHPVFDLAAIRAQARVPALQGRHHTFFAGAWTGYGFHEDGLKSGLRAAQALIDTHGLAPPPAPAQVGRCWHERHGGPVQRAARPLIGFGQVRHTRHRRAATPSPTPPTS
jgi:uncharacterized protein